MINNTNTDTNDMKVKIEFTGKITQQMKERKQKLKKVVQFGINYKPF